MKVWKINYHHPDMGHRLAWAGSLAKAKDLLKAILAEEYDDPSDAEPISIEPVSIPTDKAGLLAWLNNWFDSQND